MKKFTYKNAKSLAQAVSALKAGDAAVLAGGTDLLNQLTQGAFANPPAALVSIKNIPGLKAINETTRGLKIGALAKLADIAASPLVQSQYTALAQAAAAVASPAIRNMGTLGGNLCQQFQCWYWKRSFNTGASFDCLRKDGAQCFALTGENQYHSIFGGLRAASPPCQSACPGHVDIPSYLSLIREGRLNEAAQILLDANPLPAITGRVCRQFCEQRCNRNEFNEAVSTRDIERFLGDYILEHASELLKPPQNETGKSAAIVGSGPAGLAAAYYLRQAGNRVTVFEQMSEAGGMLAYVIPEYRLPKEVVRRAVKAIENMGVEFKLNVDIGQNITLDQLKQNFNAVFLATGAWKPLPIELEGEALTRFGMEFLENINLGNKEVPGKKVLVIGGGSAAIDVAISARRLGVKDVTLACLESRTEMPALPWEIEQAVEEGVNLMPSWGPHTVLQSGGKVTGLELVRCASVYNHEGRFAPAFDKAVKQTVEADCVMMAVGYATDLHFIGRAAPLEVERGLVQVDPQTQATAIEGIFAGGTVAHGPATVIEAIAAGKRAAIAIDRYLTSHSPRLSRERPVQPYLKFNSSCFQKTGRVKAPKLSVSERKIDVEDNQGLSLSAIEDEANRCFNCSCLAVNSSDLAPALIALDAKIKTTKRVIEAEKFFQVAGDKTTILDNDEIVLQIRVPKPAASVKSLYLKFALRNSIDFPVVSCAAAIETRKGRVKTARICLNAVSGKPYRTTKAEDYIRGKPIDESSAAAAADAVVFDACPLPENQHKVQIARTLIKRAILTLSPK